MAFRGFVDFLAGIFGYQRKTSGIAKRYYYNNESVSYNVFSLPPTASYYNGKLGTLRNTIIPLMYTTVQVTITDWDWMNRFYNWGGFRPFVDQDIEDYGGISPPRLTQILHLISVMYRWNAPKLGLKAINPFTNMQIYNDSIIDIVINGLGVSSMPNIYTNNIVPDEFYTVTDQDPEIIWMFDFMLPPLEVKEQHFTATDGIKGFEVLANGAVFNGIGMSSNWVNPELQVDCPSWCNNENMPQVLAQSVLRFIKDKEKLTNIELPIAGDPKNEDTIVKVIPVAQSEYGLQ